MRCETETWPFDTDVVMSPSVRPFNLRGDYAHLLGRSPDLRVAGLKIAFPVPHFWFLSGILISNLAAHSCGGSHGFGPFWVVLTVFPVRPLAFA
jgi:hypothetical protein